MARLGCGSKTLKLQLFQLSATTLEGNPSREGILEMYENKSGLTVNNPVFYYVFGLFKIAVIAQQIYFRYKKGFTKDKRFGLLNLAVISLSVMDRVHSQTKFVKLA